MAGQKKPETDKTQGAECQKMSHATLWGQMSHLHAIFGTLSRKTVLMENHPYHLPLGATEAEDAEWGGGPKNRFGGYPLTVQPPEQAWWFRAG